MAFDKQILNNEVDIIAKLAIGGDYDFGLINTIGADRYFRAIGSSPNIIINLIPKGTGTLRVPSGYETLLTDPKDLINKGYADIKILGKDASAILLAPGTPQNGYSITWDQATGKFTLTPSAFTKTFASGIEDVANIIKWGGPALDRHTDIIAAGLFNVNLGTVASKLLNFGVNTVQKAELIAGAARLTLNGTNPVELLGGVALSTFIINAGGGFILTDNQGGTSQRGLRGGADYSAMIQDNDYAQKIYVDNRIGGKNVNILIKNPTTAQNNYSVVWDQSIAQYTLKDISLAGASTIPKKQKFVVVGTPQSTFTVDNGTILYLNFVDINGSVQAEGDDYVRSGQSISVVPALPVGAELTVHYWEDLSLGGDGDEASAVQNGHFLFNDDIAETDPTDGKVKFNNGSFGAVTRLYIDSFTMDGSDIGLSVGDLATGDEIRLQLNANDDNHAIYTLLAMPEDNAGWWAMTVAIKSYSGAIFSNGAEIVVVMAYNTGALDQIDIDGGVADSIYNTLPIIDGGVP